MKITKENVVAVKNTYFFVTVFFAECVLSLIAVCFILGSKYFFPNIFTEEISILISFIILTITWYIALNLGVYNVFNSKRIAKKNLAPLKKSLIKDWKLFIVLSILLCCHNEITFLIGIGALFINFPLVSKVFDRIAKHHYKTI